VEPVIHATRFEIDGDARCGTELAERIGRADETVVSGVDREQE
jgi:hypothetical protein